MVLHYIIHYPTSAAKTIWTEVHERLALGSCLPEMHISEDCINVQMWPISCNRSLLIEWPQGGLNYSLGGIFALINFTHSSLLVKVNILWRFKAEGKMESPVCQIPVIIIILQISHPQYFLLFTVHDVTTTTKYCILLPEVTQ